MKEEIKITNIACKDYVQHQFKHNYCAKCFKPLSQHSIISQTLEPVNVKIIELQTGDNNDTAPKKTIVNKLTPFSVNNIQVNESHENGFTSANGFQNDAETYLNGRSSKKEKTPPLVKEKSSSRLKRQTHVTKGAEVKTNGKFTPRIRRADSVPENGTISPTKKEVCRLTLSDDSNSTCPEENSSLEFQRIGKSLKRVNKFLKEENKQEEESASTSSENVTSPDGIVNSKDTDLKRKKEIIAAKSDLQSQLLSNAAHSAFNIEKHDTLPRNIGRDHKRPTIADLSERHDSDPEMYEPEQKVEEIDVVLLNGDINSGNISQNKKVKGSQISSEIYFGMNIHENSNNSTNNNHMSSSREIKIISADGSVSRYTESPPPPPCDSRVSINSSTLSNLSLHSSGSSFSTSSSNVQPYRVVDLEVQECAPYVVTDVPGTSHKQGYQKVDRNVQNGHRQFQQKITLVDSTYTVKEKKFGRQTSGDEPEYEEPADDSPTLPTILHHEIQALPKSAKRNSDSSLYRVPIYIGSNAGGESSKRISSSSTTQNEFKSPNEEYLQPMRSSSCTSTDTEHNVHNYDSVPESDFSDMSKSTSSSGESSGFKKQYRSRKSAEVKVNNKKVDSCSRKRSITHPTSNSPVQNKNSVNNFNFSDEDPENNRETPVKLRQKRNAPPPPPPESKSRRSLSLNNVKEVENFTDTMPKIPPPPPPHQNIERKSSQPVNIPKSNIKTFEVGRKVTPPKQNGSHSHSSPKSKTLPVNTKAPKIRDKTPERNTDGKKRPAPVLNRLDQSPNDKSIEKKPIDPVSDVLASYSPPRSGLPPSTTTSPQRPITLPVDAIDSIQPTVTRESKGKWSKLPWRKNRSRRKEDGSPEREFNSKGVTDWLLNKHMTEDEIAAVSHEENLKKLEVIKAYKGEPIPVIESSHVDYSAVATEHGLSTFYINANTPIDAPPLPRLTNNFSKRKAPGPPDVLQSDQLLLDEFKTRKKKLPAKLQKAHSFTSVSSSIKDRSMDDYENWGPIRNGLPVPTKPSRRFRNRTTAFENLPSQLENTKKRMAPQLPQENCLSQENWDKSSPNQSSQDEADRPQPLPRKRSNSASASSFRPVTPLKSAMKNLEDNHNSGDNKTPKRPVRVLDPGTTNKEKSQESTENVYANVDELLSDADIPSRLKPMPTPRNQKLMVDQGTSPLRTLSEESESSPISNGLNPLDPFFAKINNRNMLTLSKISSAWQNSHESCPRLDQVVLRDFKLTSDHPCFTSSEARFYPAELIANKDKHFTLMMFTDPETVDPLYSFIMSIQLLLPHPHIINVCSASKSSVPNKLIRPKPSPSKCPEPADQSEEMSESLLVALAVQPVSSVSKLVSYSKEKHNFLPEQYEGEIITVLLQLFSGLQHLENNNISLSTVKMENLLLIDSGLPGGGNYLVVDYLNLAERDESERVNDTLLSPSIVNKTNEFDVGILIYKMLHEPNPFSVKTNLIIRDYKPSDFPKIPKKSRYSLGLQKLAGELLRKNPNDRLSARQSIGFLQLLLWGPSVEDLVAAESDNALDGYLTKWHAEECAKMVNYIAEQKINEILGNSKSFSMADQLHCQFLSNIDLNLLKNSFKLLNS
ncbi:uncharacterized protein [Antedon mediterranea]|uniref:uncharacterized protein n=1 Tax=Antedon mediterranea TaxID=105859 RepID=UPI003AF9D884